MKNENYLNSLFGLSLIYAILSTTLKTANVKVANRKYYQTRHSLIFIK